MGVPGHNGQFPGGPYPPAPPPKNTGKAILNGLAIAAPFLLLGFIAASFLMMPADFRHYLAKAKQSEAKSSLGELEVAQTLHRLQAHEYAGSGGPRKCFEILAWQPEGKIRYTYFCGEEKFPCTWPGCDPCPSIKNLSSIGKDSYTLMAVGNIDRDPTCDVWTINDAKVLVNVTNDISH
jgi:hypothetical protein